jgi:hypothetical protein
MKLRIRWAEYVAWMQKREMVRKPERKPTQKMYAQTDNIKMNLTEIGYEGVNWIYLSQDRIQW